MLLYTLTMIIRPPVREVLYFARAVSFSYFFRQLLSEVRRPIAVKLCHMIGNWVLFIN